MSDSGTGRAPFDRRRSVWWLVAAGLAVVVGLIVRSFVGTLVFGLFVYYAVRPIYRRLLTYAESRVMATTTTMVVAAVPLLLVVVYGAGLAVQELLAAFGTETTGVVLSRFVENSASFTRLVQNPTAVLADFDRITQIQENLAPVLGTVGVVGSVFLRLSLSLAVAFFLLQDGHRIEQWFRSEVADADSTAYVFFRGVDSDLETVYFGNVLTVIGVTVASIVVYNSYNVLAPPTVSIPVPTLLALLTGIATFVPLVVGKLVYLPVGVFLLWKAFRFDASVAYPVGFLVAAFLLLDILPQTFLRPLISGRSLHSGLVLFGYVLGAAYFGWYGLFLGPLIVVLGVQFLKHVLPDLADGSEFVPEEGSGVDIGTDPLTESGPDVPVERGVDEPGDGVTDVDGDSATDTADDDSNSPDSGAEPTGS